jgi:hypothetical protein
MRHLATLLGCLELEMFSTGEKNGRIFFYRKPGVNNNNNNSGTGCELGKFAVKEFSFGIEEFK